MCLLYFFFNTTVKLLKIKIEIICSMFLMFSIQYQRHIVVLKVKLCTAQWHSVLWWWVGLMKLVKFVALSGRYSMFLSGAGSIQYAFSSVSFGILNANSSLYEEQRRPTSEQTSPRPVLQSQSAPFQCPRQWSTERWAFPVAAGSGAPVNRGE